MANVMSRTQIAPLKRGRAKSGAILAETAASMVVLIPLALLLILVIAEVSYAYMIKTSLAQAARQAARDLAVGYGKDPAIATSRELQEAMVFEHIRITNMVKDSRQFDDPVFNTTVQPHTVFVRVRYSSDVGLPLFPFPVPLCLGDEFILTADATYRLE